MGLRGTAGSVHDKKAEWIWGVLAELEAAGLVTLADKGYQGSAYAKIPYRNKPESQKEANRARAKLRSPSERANAELKTWHILRKLRCCPGAPDNSPRPFTYCRSTRHNQDGEGSLRAWDRCRRRLKIGEGEEALTGGAGVPLPA